MDQIWSNLIKFGSNFEKAILEEHVDKTACSERYKNFLKKGSYWIKLDQIGSNYIKSN